MALVRLVIALAAGVLVVPVALAEPRAHVADGGSRAIVASPGPLVVGLHLPDRGFQVGAVRGDRVTYAAGLEAELARAVAARLGRNPRFVQIDLARLSRRGPKKWELALARLLPAATGGVTYSAPYLRGDPVVLVAASPPAARPPRRPRHPAALHDAPEPRPGDDRPADPACGQPARRTGRRPAPRLDPDGTVRCRPAGGG